jgi:GDPmannose 4,6-dehydratase
MKTALITGVTGQDGAYLSELLFNKRIYRSLESNEGAHLFKTGRIDHLYQDPQC